MPWGVCFFCQLATSEHCLLLTTEFEPKSMNQICRPKAQIPFFKQVWGVTDLY